MQPIADFSELGDFLNMPVRYYSAGMMVRLAFSIATAIEPEILIVDEVLAAGDLAFQTKARDRMRALMSNARAVIVVSHDLAIVAAAVRPRAVARPRQDANDRPDGGSHCVVHQTSQSEAQRQAA